MTIILAIPFGIAIGIALGLVGGGGSILAVPVLIYVLGEPIKDATTASLLVVTVSALAGAVGHRRRRGVDFRIALSFAGVSAVGAVFGTVLNRGSRPTVIVAVLAVIMLGAAAAMLRRTGAQASTPPVAGRALWVRLIPAAFAVGVLTGYAGVGGGFLIVPVLTLLIGLHLKQAIGTSLVIIALTSAVGLVAHLQSGSINWSIALPFAGAAIVGSVIGAHYSARTSRQRLTRGFAALVTVIAFALLASTVASLA